MIATLIIWIYILFLSFTYGLISYNIACRTKIIEKSENIPRIDLLSLVGLCILMSALGFYSIFFKIGLFVNAILFLSAVIYLGFNKYEYRRYFLYSIEKVKESGKTIIPLGILFSSYILILSVKYPQVYDTGLYHAQFIKWIEQYKVVLGLGNLHSRFAFNSHFFLPSALFSFSFLNIQPFYLINSYLFFLFSLTTISYLSDAILHKNKYTYFYTSLLILGFYQFNYWISSPTPDISSSIFIWYIFLIILLKIELNSLNIFDFNYFTILILSFSLLTIKVSTAPIFLVTFYVVFACRKSLQVRQYLYISLIIIIIILPWLLRNVILSGYLIYPFPSIDIFNFDWKMPINDVISEKKWIYSWARLPYIDCDEVLSLSVYEWFPIWFKAKSTIQEIFFLIVSTSPIVFGVSLLFNLNKLRRNTSLVILWGISFIGFIFWFLTAPDFRFGYGFILICFLITLFFILKETFLSSKTFSYFMILILFMFSIKNLISSTTGFRSLISSIYSNKAQIDISFLNHWLLPEKYKKIETKTISINNLKVLMPKEGCQCWNETLPCTPYLNNKLELRGTHISDGFRIKQ